MTTSELETNRRILKVQDDGARDGGRAGGRAGGVRSRLRLGMALKASKVVGNPITLHRIW
jgi:hypothetical protein